MTVLTRISTSLSGKSAERKRVTFTEVDQIDQFDAYENSEELWFSESEEFDFQEANRKMGTLLKCMDCNAFEFQTGESPRGLEYAKREFETALQSRRRQSVQAVLAMNAFLHNPKSIHQYRLASKDAMRDALERAKLDERFVMDHVRNTTTASRNFEKRSERPSIMGRQPARRSLTDTNKKDASSKSTSTSRAPRMSFDMSVLKTIRL